MPGLMYSSSRPGFCISKLCYDGHIDDSDIPVLIHGTADYIRQAERLASLNSLETEQDCGNRGSPV